MTVGCREMRAITHVQVDGRRWRTNFQAKYMKHTNFVAHQITASNESQIHWRGAFARIHSSAGRRTEVAHQLSSAIYETHQLLSVK